MKFKGSIEINKPQTMVAEYFADPTYLTKYQDSFLRKELLSGEQGKDGAVSCMFYTYGKGVMELTETIISNNLPHSFEAFYHHKHMDNTMKCTFISLDENKTKYLYEFEYVRMSWVLPKLMSLLFPGMFKRQAEKWVRQFKEFVEKQA